MLSKAFDAQCAAVKVHCTDPLQQQKSGLTLFALALGSFCIGTSEFASMGILQLFAASLRIDLPAATNAITAYAFGVVTRARRSSRFAAARLNRRTLLLLLMTLFVCGNILSALATDLRTFAVARFISGVPQGAYFGAGAVVASYIVGPGHGGKSICPRHDRPDGRYDRRLTARHFPWPKPRMAEHLHCRRGSRRPVNDWHCGSGSPGQARWMAARSPGNWVPSADRRSG